MRIDFEFEYENIGDSRYVDQFLNLIIKDMKNQIIVNIDSKFMYEYSNIILTSKNIKWINNVPEKINMNYVLKLICNSIRYKHLKNNEYIIYIDRTIKMPYSRTSIEYVARLLDKGNDNYKPTWFISKVFNKYKRNMNRYWKSYISIVTKSVKVKDSVKIK